MDEEEFPPFENYLIPLDDFSDPLPVKIGKDEYILSLTGLNETVQLQLFKARDYSGEPLQQSVTNISLPEETYAITSEVATTTKWSPFGILFRRGGVWELHNYKLTDKTLTFENSTILDSKPESLHYYRVKSKINLLLQTSDSLLTYSFDFNSQG